MQEMQAITKPTRKPLNIRAAHPWDVRTFVSTTDVAPPNPPTRMSTERRTRIGSEHASDACTSPPLSGGLVCDRSSIAKEGTGETSSNSPGAQEPRHQHNNSSARPHNGMRQHNHSHRHKKNGMARHPARPLVPLFVIAICGEGPHRVPYTGNPSQRK